MGAGRDAFRAARRPKTSPSFASPFDSQGRFTPTQLGQEDFSLAVNPNTQAQVPAATAERSLWQNQRRANNVLASAAAAGSDITLPEFQPVQEMAEQGFLGKTLSAGESALGWLDALGQTVNLGIQQIFGEQPEDAERGVNALDYLNALWGGIEDPDKFFAETGLDPTSRSQTLDMLGWAAVEADETGWAANMERFVRGVADFGFSMATDPLTYVTFGLSGLGKRVALSTFQKTSDDVTREILGLLGKGTNIADLDVDKLGSSYARRIARNLQNDVDDFSFRIQNVSGEEQRALVSWAEKHGGKGLDLDDPEVVASLAYENIVELALRERMWKDFGQPLLNRDFAALRNLAPDARELLPKYAYGGVRLSINPFTRRGLETGLVVPGSEGLGRKVVGDPLRKMSKALKLRSGEYRDIAIKLDGSMNFADVDRALIRGLQQKRIEGWQYHLLKNSVDNIHNSQQKEFVFAQLNARKEKLIAAAQGAGRGDDMDRVWTEVNDIIESRPWDVEAVLNDASTIDQATGLPMPSRVGSLSALEREQNELAHFLSESYEEIHTELVRINPDLKSKYIDNYSPHVIEPEIGKIISQMAGEGATVTAKEIEAGIRSGDIGWLLLGQLINAQSLGGRAEAMVGASQALLERGIGRYSAVQFAGDTVMLDKSMLERLPQILAEQGMLGDDAVKTVYMSASEMNEHIASVLRDVAERNGIHLPKDWNGQVFNTNPIDNAFGYLSSMHDTVATWNLIEAMKSAGLAVRHSSVPDAPGILKAIYENAQRLGVKVRQGTAGKIVDEAMTLDEITGQGSLFDDVGEAVQEVAADAPMAAPQAAVPVYDDQAARRVRNAIGRTNEQAKMWKEKFRNFADTGGEGMSEEDVARIEAYGGWWHENKELFPRLVRAADHVESDTLDDIVSDGIEGGILTIGNASADETGAFAASAKGKRWTIEFEDTMGARNDLNQGMEIQGTGVMEEEIFVSGRFIVTNIDPDALTATVRPVHQNLLPGGVADNVDKFGPVWDRAKGSGGNPVRGGIVWNDGETSLVGDAWSDSSSGTIPFTDHDEALRSRGLSFKDYDEMANAEIQGKFATIDWIAERASEGAGKQIVMRVSGDWSSIGKKGRASIREFAEHHGVDVIRVEHPLTSEPITINVAKKASEATERVAKEAAEAAAPKTVAETAEKVVEKSKRVLKGYEDAVERSENARTIHGSVTLDAIAETQEAGFGDPGNARDVASLLRGGREAFRVRRGAPITPLAPLTDDAESAVRIANAPEGWSGNTAKNGGDAMYRLSSGEAIEMAWEESDGVIHAISFNVSHPNMGWRQKGALSRALYSKLDGFVRDGKLKITKQAIEDLLQTEAMTDAGADYLFNYLNRKINRLSPAVAESVRRDPAEVLSFVDEWDNMVDMVHEFITNYGGRIDPDTGWLDARNARLAGDELFMNDLTKLREAATALDEEFGFETAVELFKNFPNPIGVADRPGFTNPGRFLLAGPAIEGLSLQDDMAAWLQQVTRNSTALYTPEGVAALKQGTGTILKWWKAMATVSRPGFHIRNVIGGVWNGMIVGVGPKAYADTRLQGVAIRNAMRSGKYDTPRIAIRAAIPDAKEADMWISAFESGALSGFATSEFRNLAGKTQQEVWEWLNVADPDKFLLTKLGGHFMESIEDFMRMAVYRTWYDGPGSEAVAREMTELVHFNYTKLTPFETKVKNIIPFFVWTRRNLPLQVAQIVENPRMVQRYQHMMRGINDMWADDAQGDEPIGEHYSAFAARTGWTVNKDTPFWARAIIDPDLPIRDILDLPRADISEVMEYAMNLMGPHISTVVNLNEQREFGDVNAPAPMAAVLKSLAAVGLYDETLAGDVRVPYWVRSIQETMVPFQRDIIDPLTGGSNDPGRRARALGTTEDDGLLVGGGKAIGANLLGALGVRFTTPGDVRSRGYSSSDELDEIVRKLRLTGQVPAAQAAGALPLPNFGG